MIGNRSSSSRQISSHRIAAQNQDIAAARLRAASDAMATNANLQSKQTQIDGLSGRVEELEDGIIL